MVRLLHFQSEILAIKEHVDGLVQDCSNSSALAMELLQSFTKPSTSVGQDFVKT